jgi:3-hydroxyisobutyrate dehydrogenase
VTTAEKTTVAVLGLGAMGLPMAIRLATRYSVRAYDIFDARVSLAVDGGAIAAESPARAASEASAVLVSVRDRAQFESAMFGEGGATESLAEGSLVLLTSTIGTDAVRETAARLAERGILLVDAPVSGGAVRAAAGDLMFMVSGAASTIDLARPILDVLASTVHLVGENPGDGQTMKTVNQLLCGIHTAAAGEALALASSLGLDPDTVISVLGSGAAASFMLADRGPRMAERLRNEEPLLRSRIDIISKDMGLVHDLARRAHVSTPIAAAAEQLYLGMEARGYAAEDDSIVAVADRQ